MHKKNAIEFVTLLGFFFGFVCVNHEVFCVWCGLFLSFILFLSFFLFFFGLTLINVCTTRVDITFSSNNLLSQLRGALLKEQDVPSASVKKEERGGEKATDEANLWEMLPWSLDLCLWGIAEIFALLSSLISSCIN